MENAGNEVVKTKRDLALERLKGKYPDREFADDEAVFGQINDDFNDYDERLKGYEEREKTISDMFTSDPRSASFLANWRNGSDPVVELVRQFGTDIKDALDDPERQEAIAAANKEFVERVAKEKELDEAYQKNLDETLQQLAAMQEERGLSDEQIDNAMSFLIGIMRDAIVGKFSTEAIDMALKAINHDADVATAEHEGEVRGKNTRVAAALRKQQAGDGVAPLAGQNNQRGRQMPRPSLGALDRFGEGNQTIWERGGENRKKRSTFD